MKKENKKPRTLFSKVFGIILFLFAIICGIFVLFMYQGGLMGDFYGDARKEFNEKVTNRKDNIEKYMTGIAANLEASAESIGNSADGLIKFGGIKSASAANLENNKMFLTDVCHETMLLARMTGVSGVYLAISNKAKLENDSGAWGIFIRNLNDKINDDNAANRLFLEAGSKKVANTLNLPLSSSYTSKVNFILNSEKNGDIFSKTYENTAKYYSSGMSLGDFALWSSIYESSNENKKAVSCSVPIVLDDGTVLGIIGVEILVESLEKLIPYSELAEKDSGYFLGIEHENDLSYVNIAASGSKKELTEPEILKLGIDQNSDNYFYTGNGEVYYSYVSNINPYNSQSALNGEKWALIGSVSTLVLYDELNKFMAFFAAVILGIIFLGFIGCVLVSRMIARPVESIAKQVSNITSVQEIKLERFGIMEVDRLSQAVEDLSRQVIDTGTKFAKILKMASVNISGFEIDYEKKSFFIMDDFFNIFNLHNIDTRKLTVESFYEELNNLKQYIIDIRTEDGYTDELYRLPVNNSNSEKVAYVKLRFKDDKNKCIGLVENVTNIVNEKNQIVNERDHDLLTGLINRRAFYRNMSRMFEKESEKIKIAAMIMIDLDGLKSVNDRYGHSCGDEFICASSRCFLKYSPENAIVARMSGDEFILFYYGYEDKKAIREDIKRLKSGIASSTFLLPSGEKIELKVSGGIAWYPDNSTSLTQLIKYSDFAMYQSKKGKKGQIAEFDYTVYSQESNLMKNKKEFNELVEHMLVEYHFQPIVDAKTGEIFAYESLMRGLVDTLTSPSKILRLAKIESKLDRIEEITFIKTLEAVERNINAKTMDENVMIFINSITNQTIKLNQINLIEKLYSKHLSKLVLEIIEIERINNAVEGKKRIINSWNAKLALDDFGSGYNSDSALLSLSPDFVKVDADIIKDIDKNVDKQKIVENLIHYSHDRNIKVVAEGVETWEEAKTAILLGVDYLQGFYYGRPAKIPPKIPEEKVRQILNLNTYKV